jgi:PPOX class probable F420-dependent enzyme
MRLHEQECRSRLGTARHAVMASVGPDGRPHAVPVVFAVAADVLVTGVDQKPKETTQLRRIRNIRANPAVTLLAQEYDEDWSTLWWVRVDALATVEDGGATWQQGIDLLVARYAQYRDDPPRGPVIRMLAQRWSGWAAGPVRPAAST